MIKLLEDVKKIATSDASVFIVGESGTGKEVIAHSIHEHSKRENNPFIKVNCAAIPDTLIESEFFGHERGAFTGAMNRRQGRFELADRGTLLLDEVSEIPLPLQSKLLRAIQEQEFERVGGSHPIHVNVRFIATSNRNMQEAIADKAFRLDLFYRLNVMPIHLPPLRERVEDILPLAGFFLKLFSPDEEKALSSVAKQSLLDYHWPGNIRELANIIERAVVLCNDQEISNLAIETPLIPKLELPKIHSSSPTLKEVERRHILETLLKFKNNKTRAALALGISIRTLRNKLSGYSKRK